MNQNKEEKFFLRVEYLTEYEDKKFNILTPPHVTIVGNKKGLKYLVKKISDYLENGDCDYDNLNFDIGPDLSEGVITLDIVCDDECLLQKSKGKA